MDITEIEIKKTFKTKNGENFVVIAVDLPKNIVQYIPETNYGEYRFIGLSGGDIQPVNATVEEFKDSFRAWITGLAERKAQKAAKKKLARERFNSFKEDYEEAVKIDLFIDAAHGGGVESLVKRLDAILNQEKKKTKKARAKVQKAFEDGVKKGRVAGFEEGLQYPRTSLEGTGFHDYMDS